MPEDAPRDDRYLLLTLAQALRLAHRIVDIATQYQRDLERAAERRRFNDECRAEGAKGQVPRPDSRRPAGATQPTLPAPLKDQAAGPL